VTEILRRVDAAWLREAPLKDLLAVLDGGGEEARVVGGAVRNALLAEPIGEIDVATTALPTEVIRRAQEARAIVRDRDADAEAWIFISLGLLSTIDRRLNGLVGDEFDRIRDSRRAWMTGQG